MRQRGFTLLEIMIVVVIIGIVTASVVSVAFGDRKNEKLKQEATRLKAVINLAQEEAVLESRIYALGIWQKGYGFYVPDSEGWALLDRRTDKRLGERKLPEENGTGNCAGRHWGCNWKLSHRKNHRYLFFPAVR